MSDAAVLQQLQSAVSEAEGYAIADHAPENKGFGRANMEPADLCLFVLGTGVVS